jgi:hypothetical protein
MAIAVSFIENAKTGTMICNYIVIIYIYRINILVYTLDWIHFYLDVCKWLAKCQDIWISYCKSLLTI